MSEKTLSEALLENNIQYMKMMMESEGHLVPIISCIGKDESIRVIQAIFRSTEEKINVFRLLRIAFACWEIETYSFSAEAWVIERPLDTDLKNVIPSEEPDRKEAIQTTVVSREEILAYHAIIERHPDGKYKGIGEERRMREKNDQTHGPQTNLLPPKGLPPISDEVKKAVLESLKDYLVHIDKPNVH